MQKHAMINGHLMQRQPCQQQQGGFLGLGAPVPSTKTLIGGITPPSPPAGLVPDATGRVPAPG